MMPVVTVWGTGKQTGMRGDNTTGVGAYPSESELRPSSGRGWAAASVLGINPEVIQLLEEWIVFSKEHQNWETITVTKGSTSKARGKPRRLQHRNSGRKTSPKKEVISSIKIHRESKCSGTGQVPETWVNRGHEDGM